MELKCSVCKVQACREEPGAKPIPVFCPASDESNALAKARQTYRSDADIQRLARSAAQVEAAGYCNWPRVQEVMKFAQRIGVSHLGIATCVGLLREAGLLQEILETNGFHVSTVCCKVGSIPKEEIGLKEDEKIHHGKFEALCNPIGQASLLHEAGTELNIAQGLCEGTTAYSSAIQKRQ